MHHFLVCAPLGITSGDGDGHLTVSDGHLSFQECFNDTSWGWFNQHVSCTLSPQTSHVLLNIQLSSGGDLAFASPLFYVLPAGG
jgi:hypothetical protein